MLPLDMTLSIILKQDIFQMAQLDTLLHGYLCEKLMS